MTRFQTFIVLILWAVCVPATAQDLPEVPGVWEGHVKGIGGIFFKVENPDLVRQWYQDHFGIPAVEPGFAHFFWRDYLASNKTHRTVWRDIFSRQQQ